MNFKTIPQHVGIIMDGNRRWARRRGLPSLVGHRRGYDRAVEVSEYAFEKGVRFLTLFAFSTENWNRSKKEVAYLMNLLLQMINDRARALHKKGIRLLFIGTRRRLNKRITAAITQAEDLTKSNKRGTLIIALSYGGREEILHAITSLRGSRNRVTEKTFARHLYTKGIPDPELIIRTSGEQRLSGFLLWQAAYSELYFTPTLWPDFKASDFDRALSDFKRRQRRFGS